MMSFVLVMFAAGVVMGTPGYAAVVQSGDLLFVSGSGNKLLVRSE